MGGNCEQIKASKLQKHSACVLVYNADAECLCSCVWLDCVCQEAVICIEGCLELNAKIRLELVFELLETDLALLLEKEKFI